MFLGIVFSVVLMGDIIEKVTSVVGGSSFYIFNHLSKYSYYNYTPFRCIMQELFFTEYFTLSKFDYFLLLNVDM